MAKSAREKIRLVSSAGTGHFYTTDKNKRNMPDKMEIKKYDPTIRKHVIYKEAKIKQAITFMNIMVPLISGDLFAQTFCCVTTTVRSSYKLRVIKKAL